MNSAIHSSSRRVPLTLLSLALLLFAGAAAADYLVLHDGQIIATKGPWKEEGRRITYTAVNGTFSALRTSMVNVERSRELTAESKRPKPPPPRAEDKTDLGLVVRQSDLRHRARASTAAPPTQGPTVIDGEIGVTQWDEVVVAEGTKLVGTLRNRTDSTYLSLRLEVTLVGPDGEALATQTAELEKNWMDPATSLGFEVDFAEVFAYDNAAFEINGRPFARPAPQDQGGDDDTDPPSL